MNSTHLVEVLQSECGDGIPFTLRVRLNSSKARVQLAPLPPTTLALCPVSVSEAHITPPRQSCNDSS